MDKITNWREVEGEDAKVVAYQRPENSGSQTGMLSLVMKDKKIKEPKTEEYIETMAGIIDAVLITKIVKMLLVILTIIMPLLCMVMIRLNS